MLHSANIKKIDDDSDLDFPLAQDPFYSPENQRVLLQSINQINAGHASEHEILDDE